MTRKFTENERYRPIVKIDRIKNDIPTVIIVGGRRYVYDPQTVHRKRRGKK